jgi:NAD-dependent deacetylase
LTTPIDQVSALLRNARSVVVLTGAGISTESGIPDFRGPQGVWTKNPAAQKLSTLKHYLADPDVRRNAWQLRLKHEAWGAKPNAGHLALAQLERLGRLDTLITQNIDGLHQLAGSSPERVIEIHGTILEVTCMSCAARGPMRDTLERVRQGEADPACLACGGILKSATISFGQELVQTDLQRAERAARGCDVLLALGSTLSVFPVAGLVPLASRAGALIVIVNAAPTDMDKLAEVVIHGALGAVLPQLIAQLSD